MDTFHGAERWSGGSRVRWRDEVRSRQPLRPPISSDDEHSEMSSSGSSSRDSTISSDSSLSDYSSIERWSAAGKRRSRGRPHSRSCSTESVRNALRFEGAGRSAQQHRNGIPPLGASPPRGTGLPPLRLPQWCTQPTEQEAEERRLMEKPRASRQTRHVGKTTEVMQRGVSEGRGLAAPRRSMQVQPKGPPPALSGFAGPLDPEWLPLPDDFNKMLDESKRRKQLERERKQRWLEDVWEQQQLEEEQRKFEEQKKKFSFQQNGDSQRIWRDIERSHDEERDRQHRREVQRDLAQREWRQRAEERECVKAEEQRRARLRQRLLLEEQARTRSNAQMMQHHFVGSGMRAAGHHAGRPPAAPPSRRGPHTPTPSFPQQYRVGAPSVADSRSSVSVSTPMRPDFRRRHVLKATHSAEPWTCRAWGG